MRGNIRVALRYLAAWLGGNGCVPIDHLMEDAATAEISRAQLWQWIRHPDAKLDNGQNIDADLFGSMRGDILASLLESSADENKELLKISSGTAGQAHSGR